MVKTVMFSMTLAMAAADDAASLLQMSVGARQSRGERILAAVAEQGKDTICVQAAAGDIAPVTGTFTTRMRQQAVLVEAGSVAKEAGSFCVAKQDVLLIQRTLGLNTARDFDAALGSKNIQATTTTTTLDYAEIDFAGDLTKQVTVKPGECPTAQSGLVQTVEALVSDKQQEKLTADQMRVCGCRNFLIRATEGAEPALGQFSQSDLDRMLGELGAAAAAAEPKGASAVLLQRDFDTALASKSMANATTTTATTTTTTIIIDYKWKYEPLAKACTLASERLPGSWTSVAKMVNNPNYTVLFNSFNITGGWEHCDKSWVVQGACGGFVDHAPCKYERADGRNCSAVGGSAVCCAQIQQDTEDKRMGKERDPDDTGDACKPFRDQMKYECSELEQK